MLVMMIEELRQLLFKLFIWGFTVQDISRQVVFVSRETSTYSWSRFCTVNCRPSVRNYQLSHIRSGV